MGSVNHRLTVRGRFLTTKVYRYARGACAAGHRVTAKGRTVPTKRVYHAPIGDPCVTCQLPATRHRVSHVPKGDPCTCGLPYGNHYRKHQPTLGQRSYYVGIDGEGQGRQDHRYVLLAWSNASGSRSAYIEAPTGGRLSTEECLEFILDLPIAARPFSYAFQYDLTKILTDVDDATLWLLFRPERRPKNKWGLCKPVKWGPYQLNIMGSRFSVKRGKDLRVIWDVFKFYQAKFTSALEDWKVESKERLAWMREMKDQRANFDKLPPDEVRAYCFEECRYMAALAKKLDDAHDAAGLTLRNYFGAGSTAGAILKRIGVDKMQRNAPAEMDMAVAMAFFGGRFENSVVGDIPGEVWGYDISSAYPYQLYFLPCLDCGRWRKTKKRKDLETARAALVRYGFSYLPNDMVWGPFPFRLPEGSICFPAFSGGGWVWRDEYLQGERLFPHVRFREAWVYESNCDHRPFADIPGFYVERLRIGKEGPGIVLKLGMNSCYGKLAQSVGVNPPFQSWPWASMVTSGTRGQLLELYGLHQNPANVLMMATDGVYSREKLDTPLPRDTGTAHAVDDKGAPANKPLGGWERKVVPQGMFAARPGIYFPMNPTDAEIKQIRARGLGRSSMLENWLMAVEAWRSGASFVEVKKVSRFWGAKSTVSRSLRKNHKPTDEDAWEYNRSERYGQWESRPVKLSFHPLPKREFAHKDGTLQIRTFAKDMVSEPYKRSVKSMDALMLRMALQEILEQPDGDDFTDYEE